MGRTYSIYSMTKGYLSLGRINVYRIKRDDGLEIEIRGLKEFNIWHKKKLKQGNNIVDLIGIIKGTP